MDERTKKNIATLVPKAQPWAEAHMDAIVKSGKLPAGWSVRIISGNRTWAEQDALYAKGRPHNGPKVTNARGGQSNHNFGIAWDIGVFDAAGKYVPEHPLYADLGPVGVKLGLEWGGNWVTIKDRPHYQVKVGLSTSQLRDLMIHNKPIPVPEYGGGAEADAATDKVTVFDGDSATKIPAFLEGGRVWVGVRAFVDQFGGEVVSASDSAFTIELHGDPISFPGKIKEGVGYAKFADVNLVLGWGFKFSGNRLVIDTK